MGAFRKIQTSSGEQEYVGIKKHGGHGDNGSHVPLSHWTSAIQMGEVEEMAMMEGEADAGRSSQSSADFFQRTHAPLGLVCI
jgi:hypothetical protein